jgi:hypothetical protein
MELCFVSVHGPRETYFVDEPRISLYTLNCFSERTALTERKGSSSPELNLTQVLVASCFSTIWRCTFTERIYRFSLIKKEPIACSRMKALNF